MKVEGIATDKHGLPAMWERGGLLGEVGRAVVIADSRGKPLRPVKSGFVPGGRHALLLVMRGFHVIEVDYRDGAFTIRVWRIHKVASHAVDAETWGATVTLERLHTFYVNVGWDTPPPANLRKAVTEAKRKARTPDCGRPFYVDPSRRWTPPERRWWRYERARLREERNRRRHERNTAEALARSMSKAAKPELTGSLEALDERLRAIGSALAIRLDTEAFQFDGFVFLYTKDNVADVERDVQMLEAEHAERQRAAEVRAEFASQLEPLVERARRLGVSVTLTDGGVVVSGSLHPYPFSQQTVDWLTRELDHLERGPIARD